jgi:ferredoxin-NADP reductase
VDDITKTVFYACGPTELVEATRELVVNGLNVPKEQMLLEKWG